MPVTEVVTPPTQLQEPIQVGDLQLQVRTNYDLTSTDPEIVAELNFMRRKIRAAREMVEGFCGRPFAPQVLRITFALDEAYELPTGSGTPSSVTGFITDIAQLPESGGYAYSAEYAKGISVNRDLPLSHAVQQTYTVTVAVDPPAYGAAEEAILELAAEMYKNRETSVNGSITVETQVAWTKKLAHLRIKPIVF